MKEKNVLTSVSQLGKPEGLSFSVVQTSQRLSISERALLRVLGVFGLRCASAIAHLYA
jgi:hypothetical protein